MLKTMLKTIKAKAKELKKQILTLYLVYMRKEIRAYKKAFLLLIIIYALSPIDLIPDFIPVLGMLDDLILIPLGILIAIKIIPRDIWEECRKEAEKGVAIDPKYQKIGVGFILLIWVIGLLLILKVLFFS